MGFKVTTAERENVARVSTLDVPADFLAAMEAEYAATVADPTKEIVIEGDNEKETALYVQWAKFWGMNRDEKLSVFKLATKKGGNTLIARLQTKAYDPNATKRGRKPNSPEAPAEKSAKK